MRLLPVRIFLRQSSIMGQSTAQARSVWIPKLDNWPMGLIIRPFVPIFSPQVKNAVHVLTLAVGWSSPKP